MKINKLQINDFGKFSNKEIEFKDDINVIKGDNEAGKSTIQKFIISMLYGISKDKRKSSFTDYDKYFPWGKESFSGKIAYSLDNNQKFEVYRDFTKKMPIIYNENAEDITSRYGSSRAKGSDFFEEQTGVDEKTMLSSMIAEQGETIIDQSSENFIIQKIANLAQTGDEKVSYENAQSYLTKKRNEEIGTDKTKNKPINILNNEKINLLNELNELQEYTNEQYEIEEKIQELNNKSKQNEKLLQFVLDYRKIADKEKETNSRIRFYKENITSNLTEKEETDEKLKIRKKEFDRLQNEYNTLIEIEEKEEEKRNLRIETLQEEKNKRKKVSVIIPIFMIMISVVCLFFKLIPVALVSLVVAGIVFCIGLKTSKGFDEKIEEELKYEKSKRIDELNESILECNDEIKEKELKVELLNQKNDEIKNQIKEEEKQIEKCKKDELDKLISKYEGVSEDYISVIENEKILDKVQDLEETCNNDKVELEKLLYRKKLIMPRIERLAEIQERIHDIEEKEEDLRRKALEIQIASDILKDAYEEMKENVVPRFTDNLSNTISKISNGKYTRVLTNDKEGLIIEKENGEYVPAKALSIGTIDQLYLSLRLAITREATSEAMPIILDEAFAYYDSKRLSNILDFISKEFGDNQIILFTCTSREIEKMKKLKVNYNLIEI